MTFADNFGITFVQAPQTRPLVLATSDIHLARPLNGAHA